MQEVLWSQTSDSIGGHADLRGSMPPRPIPKSMPHQSRSAKKIMNREHQDKIWVDNHDLVSTELAHVLQKRACSHDL